jgi:hypothetical protein
MINKKNKMKGMRIFQEKRTIRRASFVAESSPTKRSDQSMKGFTNRWYTNAKFASTGIYHRVNAMSTSSISTRIACLPALLESTQYVMIVSFLKKNLNHSVGHAELCELDIETTQKY